MVDSEFPPTKPTGKPPVEVLLTGTVFPWDDKEGPVLLGMHDSPHFWLPCFSDPDMLHAFMARIGIQHDRVKLIEDQWGFLESLPRKSGEKEIRVMLDPHYTPEGRIRYKQVLVD